MGRELVEQLSSYLVVMDIRMQGMDGVTCSRAILEKNPHIKILILSGHDEVEYASEGIRIGIFDYLLKPINVVELKKAVTKAREVIFEEKNRRNEYKRFKEELEKHSSYIMDKKLGELIQSSSPEKYLESLSYFGVQIEPQDLQTNKVQNVTQAQTQPKKEDCRLLERTTVEMQDTRNGPFKAETFQSTTPSETTGSLMQNEGTMNCDLVPFTKF